MTTSNGMELFAAQKATPDCLSDLQMTRRLNGTAISEADANHFATCNACKVRFAIERDAVAAINAQAMPAAIRDAIAVKETRKGLLNWNPVWLIAPVAAALVAVVIVPRNQQSNDTPTLKGAASLNATVKRGENIIVEDTDLASLRGKLVAGDMLRIRIAGVSRGFVRVRGLEDGVWETYFTGNIPADGLLPTGMEISSGDRTALELTFCEAKPATDDFQDCNKRVVEF